MLTKISLFVLLFTSWSPSFAWATLNRDDLVYKLAQTSKELALSHVQKEKVIPILRHSFTMHQRAFAEYQTKSAGSHSLRALRTLQRKMDHLDRQTNQLLRAMLSESQMTTYRKLQKERRDLIRTKLAFQ